MIRAFLFDIGNVIVRFDFAKALRAIAAHSEVADEADALALIDQIKLRYEDGQLTRAEFLLHTFALLKYRGSEAQFIAAWQGIFTANAPMHTLIERLATRHPIFLLSNTNDMHIEGLFRDFPVFRHITGGTYSHSARASKPQPRIYEIACEQHGLTPADTLFIDDLADNIATARKLGFQTHHYHPDRHPELLEKIGPIA